MIMGLISNCRSRARPFTGRRRRHILRESCRLPESLVLYCRLRSKPRLGSIHVLDLAWSVALSKEHGSFESKIAPVLGSPKPMQEASLPLWLLRSPNFLPEGIANLLASWCFPSLIWSSSMSNASGGSLWPAATARNTFTTASKAQQSLRGMDLCDAGSRRGNRRRSEGNNERRVRITARGSLALESSTRRSQKDMSKRTCPGVSAMRWSNVLP
jgi:hypothetical protein